MGINDSEEQLCRVVQPESLFRIHAVKVPGFGIRQLFGSFVKEITMPETSRRSEQIREYQKKLDENPTPEGFQKRVRANACPKEDMRNFDLISSVYPCVYVAKRGRELYAVKKLSKLESLCPVGSTSTSCGVERPCSHSLAKLLREKKFLYAMENEFIVKLHYTCRTFKWLFLVMEFAPYGTLGDYRAEEEEETIHFVAQIVLGLEYMHSCNLIHCDLRADQCLIFEGRRLKICDFGETVESTSKPVGCRGAIEYCAPEQGTKEPFCDAVDWWALGITIHSLRARRHPFLQPSNRARNSVNDYYRRMKTGDIIGLAQANLNEDGKDLVKQLLRVKVADRLGTGRNGAAKVKEHAWFKNIEFWDVVFELSNRPLPRNATVGVPLSTARQLVDMRPEGADPESNYFKDF